MSRQVRSIDNKKFIKNTLLHTSGPGHVFEHHVCKMEIKPNEEPRISLGTFTKTNPARGFSIEVDPTPQDADTIDAQIISIGTPSRYELVLYIANYGPKAVCAEVWQY